MSESGEKAVNDLNSTSLLLIYHFITIQYQRRRQIQSWWKSVEPDLDSLSSNLVSHSSVSLFNLPNPSMKYHEMVFPGLIIGIYSLVIAGDLV